MSAPGPHGPVVTVFRSRLRDGAGPEYEPLAERMLALAAGMEGFVDFKSFRADDGERVSVITFASTEAHRAWRDHPEHRAAQAAGRDRLYEAFSIQVCRCEHERHFERPRLGDEE